MFGGRSALVAPAPSEPIITATPPPPPATILAVLTLSATAFTRGTSASGTIIGATALSTITASGLPSGFTIDGPARTWAWNGSGSGAASGNLTLTETLAGAANTPLATVIGYTIAALAVSRPVPSGTASFLDGAGNTVTAPIVGQPLFISPGSFTNTPTSFDYQVYSGGAAIGDATGTWDVSDPAPSFIPVDALSGTLLSVKCHGINTAGPSATTSDSAFTSALADISLTNAITAYSRTSSSGTAHIGVSLAYGAGVYEGYTRRWNVYSDSGKSTLVSTVAHILTNDDLQPGALCDPDADGVTYAVTDWLETGVEATSPNGIFYSFTYPTAISPTTAAIAMTWSATDAATISATLSGGNLTISRGGGYANCKGSRGIGTGKKVYWEITPTAALAISVADASAVLTDYWAPAFAGGTQTVHAAMYSGNDANIYYDASFGGATAFGASAVIGVALDTTVSPAKVYFAKNNVWQQSGNPAAGTGGQAMSGIGSTIYPAVQIGGGNSATANFGATAYTYTPPTGFVAP